MSARLWTADPHLGHKKVSEIRGFASTDAHDSAFAQKWRQQVKPLDEVFILGDASGGKNEEYALDFINELPGIKHLISGNHDSVAGVHRNAWKRQERFREVFASVQDFTRIRHRKLDILMSHYPYASQGDGPGRVGSRYEQFRLPDLGALLIHGHTHSSHPTAGSTTGRELCVSWDAWGRLVNQQDVDDWVVSTMVYSSIFS